MLNACGLSQALSVCLTGSLGYNEVVFSSYDTFLMPRRNSLREMSSADDLSRLDELVQDKRLGKRAKAKKNRRNRHYEKQFMRNAVNQGLIQSDEV